VYNSVYTRAGERVDKLKQRLIEVLAGCMQQTIVVDEATGEQKRSFWVCSHLK